MASRGELHVNAAATRFLDVGRRSSIEPEQANHELQQWHQQTHSQLQPQLWLNLKGTSISPHESVSFLNQMLFENDTFGDIRAITDAVLLDEDKFSDFIEQEETIGLFVLYTNNNGDLVVSKNDQSFPTGIVCKASVDLSETESRDKIFNPLVALDELAKGKWVLIETVDYKDDKKDRKNYEQIADFVQLISSLPATSSTFGNSGLWLSSVTNLECQGSEEKGAMTSFAATACLAITCHTPSSFGQLDALFLSHLLSMQYSRIGATNSGILLPTNVVTNSSASTAHLDVSYAIVLPFDVQMWKTAFELRQLLEQQESNDDA